MIDEHGYRPNVGIVLCNADRQVFWARRRNANGWQFPQGGMRSSETPEEAMYRELREEIGLLPSHVHVLGQTRDWMHYDIPEEFRRRASANGAKSGAEFRGQKQIWFLLRLTGCDQDVQLDLSHKPEFEAWRWIDYWVALDEIIPFKRDVYKLALTELEPFLKSNNSQ
jgi:putative (di)nucleoside polyphosphate hydrolase